MASRPGRYAAVLPLDGVFPPERPPLCRHHRCTVDGGGDSAVVCCGIGVLALTFRQGESAESLDLTGRELDRIKGLANAARRVMVVAEAESGQGKRSTARGGAGPFQRNSSEQATSVLRLFA